MEKTTSLHAAEAGSSYRGVSAVEAAKHLEKVLPSEIKRNNALLRDRAEKQEKDDAQRGAQEIAWYNTREETRHTRSWGAHIARVTTALVGGLVWGPIKFIKGLAEVPTSGAAGAIGAMGLLFVTFLGVTIGTALLGPVGFTIAITAPMWLMGTMDLANKLDLSGTYNERNGLYPTTPDLIGHDSKNIL